MGNFARDKAIFVKFISVGSNIPWVCFQRKVCPENYQQL
jgi:hypothetical protein